MTEPVRDTSSKSSPLELLVEVAAFLLGLALLFLPLLFVFRYEIEHIVRTAGPERK